MVACFCVLNVAQWSFNDHKREEDTDHGSMCDYHFCLETFINIKTVRKTKKNGDISTIAIETCLQRRKN